MRKIGWMLATVLACGGGLRAAEPPAPEVVEARRSVLVPEAVVVVAADMTALFQAPAGGRLRENLEKWLVALQASVAAQELAKGFLHDGSHLTVFGQLKTTLSGKPAEMFCSVLAESAVPGFSTKLQAGLAEAIPNAQAVQQPNGEGMVVNHRKFVLWLSSVLEGKGVTAMWKPLGPQPMKPMPALAKAMADLPAGKRKTEALVAMLKAHGKGQVSVAVRGTYVVRKTLDELWIRQWRYGQASVQQLLSLDWMLEVEAAVFSLEAGDTLKVNAVFVFPSEADADEAAKAVAMTLGALCQIVENGMDEPKPKSAAAPAVEPPLPAERQIGKEMLEALVMERDGKLIRLSTILPERLLLPDGIGTRRPVAAPMATIRK